MEKANVLEALILAQQRELEVCRPVAEWFRENRVYATFDHQTLIFRMFSCSKGVEECILTITPIMPFESSRWPNYFRWELPFRVFIPVRLFIPTDRTPEIWRLLVQQDYHQKHDQANSFRINFASKTDKAWISGGKLIEKLPLDHLLGIEARQILATLEQAVQSWRVPSATGASLLNAQSRADPADENRIETEFWQLATLKS